MAGQLLITNLDGERIPHPLEGDLISLGRARDNHLAYPEDSGLSRHHLVFERTGAEWHVRDLGSKNGTMVNDERITGRVRVRPGDRVRASRITLVIEPESADPFVGTVVFDASRPQVERPPAHTVTLGQLVGAERPVDARDEPSTQWTDPVTALLRAGRELVVRKPVEELFDDILKLSLEAVGASRGVLMLLDGDDLRVRALRGTEFHISSTVRDRVMKDRTSLLVGDVQGDELLRDQRSIVMQQVHSLMAVPLQTDERVLGLIYVDSPHLWRQFTPSDLNLLTVMANVAAMRLERERLTEIEEQRRVMERELEQAAEIQRQLLPSAAPLVAGWELAGYNVPCYGVGGDYYDFIRISNGNVVVALGDVAGKGLPASLLMVNLQARVQLLSERFGGPAETVTVLNRTLHAVTPPNRFVTFFLCEINPDTGELVYCNAGHNPPYLVRADGSVEQLSAGGTVLGILPSLTFEAQRTFMGPGDVLVIYSDGVTEAVNDEDEEFGEERLAEVLRNHRRSGARELIGILCDHLRDFSSCTRPADDVTIVAVRRTDGPETNGWSGP